MRCNVPEALSIRASGARSVKYTSQEFSGIDLADNRPTERLVKTAMTSTNPPGAPVNETCRTCVSTQEAYRLSNIAVR